MVNRCTFIGYVGKDPKTFDTKTGIGASFSICATTKYKDGKDDYWVNISCFGKTAELIERLVKRGALLYVEGRMQERKVEKNGETRYYHGLLLEKFQVLKFADSDDDDDDDMNQEGDDSFDLDGNNDPIEF